MIKIDFATAIATYMILSSLLVFSIWIIYTCRSNNHHDQSSESLKQCPYCTHLFMEIKKGPIAVCPRCKSLIEPEGEAAA